MIRKLEPESVVGSSFFLLHRLSIKSVKRRKQKKMANTAKASASLAYPDRFYAAASYLGLDGGSAPTPSLKQLSSKFSNDTALLLYALHQQVSENDVEFPRDRSSDLKQQHDLIWFDDRRLDLLYWSIVVVTRKACLLIHSAFWCVKQASVGPCNVPKPSVWNPAEQSKWKRFRFILHYKRRGF